MKLIPKPEGFELRDKRSDKTGRGADWQPSDALYDAQQQIQNKEVVGMHICWFEKDKEGNVRPNFRYSGEHGYKLRLLISAVGSEMGWSDK